MRGHNNIIINIRVNNKKSTSNMIFSISQLFQAFAILITIQSSLQIKPGVEAAIK